MNDESRGYMLPAQSVEWETPKALFDELDKEFHFTLDPCATKENAKCEKFYTKWENGLIQSWKGERVFVNCPYGKVIADWVEKAYVETNGYWNREEYAELVVGLLPARTETIWFHSFIYDTKKHCPLPGVEIRLLKGRLKYEIDGVPQGSATFPSMIIIWRRANDEDTSS